MTMRGRRRMLRFPASFIIVLFSLAIIIMLFLSARSARGAFVNSAEKEKTYTDTVDYFSPQCISLVELGKKVCVYPDSIANLAGGPDGDKGELTAAFWVLVKNSGRKNIPQTSWLNVIGSPKTPRVFVYLSDGVVVYATGKGNTFKDAIYDLTVHFISSIGSP